MRIFLDERHVSRLLRMPIRRRIVYFIGRGLDLSYVVRLLDVVSIQCHCMTSEPVYWTKSHVLCCFECMYKKLYTMTWMCLSRKGLPKDLVRFFMRNYWSWMDFVKEKRGCADE